MQFGSAGANNEKETVRSVMQNLLKLLGRADMTFRDVTHFTVAYGGTEDEWQSIVGDAIHAFLPSNGHWPTVDKVGLPTGLVGCVVGISLIADQEGRFED